MLSRRESPAARAGVALLSEALRHQPDGVPSPPRLRVWGARLPPGPVANVTRIGTRVRPTSIRRMTARVPVSVFDKHEWAAHPATLRGSTERSKLCDDIEECMYV